MLTLFDDPPTALFDALDLAPGWRERDLGAAIGRDTQEGQRFQQSLRRIIADRKAAREAAEIEEKERRLAQHRGYLRGKGDNAGMARVRREVQEE